MLNELVEQTSLEVEIQGQVSLISQLSVMVSLTSSQTR